jgi:hypothetical protein
MHIPPRTLSFSGCRTRAEAEARMQAHLDEIRREIDQQNETEILKTVVEGHLDIDDAVDSIEEMREQNVRATEDALYDFRQFLAREYPDADDHKETVH